MHSGVVFVLAFTLASLFERGSRYFRVDSHVRYRFSPRQTFIWGSYSNYIVTRAPVMEVSNAGRTSQTSDWYTPDGSVIFNAIYILLQRCICCVFPRDIFVSAICCIASKYPFTKFDGSRGVIENADLCLRIFIFTSTYCTAIARSAIRQGFVWYLAWDLCIITKLFE